MATQNTVNIGVNVSDNGTAKKVVKNFQEIESAANRAQKAAETASKPAGGTPGSRAVYAKGAPSGVQGLMSGEDYGRARGSAGTTGASARDFANQAQGLGGIVRLYATYAANVFAVGAAFRALSGAMDTSNMVRGLDQLGAASGTALGSLSKQLANTTGGAISLREAMEATAKASSSGMSSENILRMGQAALKASQALGVNMSDAVSRISRGITKLEPELLDELGIFVRVDDVVKKYAESTGKAASAVTDFEKRQAFANAVLDQAEKKFGAIDLDTNPYTKLAATISNLAQDTLELVNKGLTPLVNLLSASPTALAVVLSGIAATLVKQAIPAISDFRAGLAKAAEESKAVSQKKLQDVKTSLGAEMAMRIQALDDAAEAEFAKFEASSKKLVDLKATNAKKLAKYDKEALRISQLDPVDITPENIAYLENLAKKQTKVSEVYKQIAVDISAYKKVEEEYNKAQKDRNIILTEQHPLWTTIGQNEKVYHDEVNASRQRSASSQIAYTSSTRGFMAGMREAVKEFSASKDGIVTTMDLLDESGQKTGTTLTTTTKGLGLFSRSLNLAKNAAVGMTAALGTAINAFAPWLQVIGLVVAAGGALISWMSKTQEESAATSTALTAIKDSTKNLSDTIDAINKKSILEQFDPKSIAAKATAIADLTSQIRKGFESAYKELDKMGGSDRFVNWVTKLWDGDVESELSDKVSQGLARVFKTIDQSTSAGKAAAKTIQDILKVEDLSSVDAVNDALDAMSSGERRRALDLISASIKTMGYEMQVSASRGTEVVAAFDKAKDALTKFRTNFIQKDPTTEYGQSLVDAFFKLDQALKDPEQKLQAIRTLAERIRDVDAPTGLVVALQDISRDIDSLNYVAKSIADIDVEISKLQDTANSQIALTKLATASNISAGQALRNVNAQIAALKANRDVKVQVQLDMRAQIDNASTLVSQAQLAVFKTGADIVSSKLSTEWAKAGVTVTNAVATVLSGTETGIKMRAQAEKLMLSVQAQQIKVQRAAILATEANTIALEQSSLDRDKQNMDLKGSAADAAGKEIATRQFALDKRKEQVQSAQKGGSQKGMYADLVTQITKGVPGVTNDMLNLAQSLEASGAQLANINAQFKAIDVSTSDSLIQLDFKKRGENLQLTLDALKVDQERLAVSKTLNSETNTAAILEKQALDARIAQFNYQKSALAAEVQIERFKESKKAVSTKDKDSKNKLADIDKEIASVEQVREANEAAYAGSIVTQGLKNRLELINAANKSTVKAINDQFTADTRTLEAKAQQLDTSEKLLDVQAATGLLSAEYILREKSVLAEKKAQLEFAKESVVAQNTQKTAIEEIKRKEEELNATRDARIAQFDKEAQGFDSAVQYTEAELTAQKELTAERTKIQDTYDNSTKKAKATLDVLLQILGITRETNAEQERYNQLLTTANDFSNSLKGAFEGAAESSVRIASALGDVATTMTEVAINADKRAKSEKAAQASVDKAWETMDYDAVSAAEENLAKTKKLNAKQELADDIKTVNSAKKLFKEKTAAYKILNGIEKVMHITKLAMDAKELAVKLGSLATGTAAKAGAEAADTSLTFAGTIGRLPAYAAEIYGKTIGQLGPIAGPAVATALVAAMFAMFGKGGAKGGFVPSSEQRQETQGTAMGWNSEGAKIQVRRGVFGDTEAKSESIANSLELIRETSVDGLSYDNKMVALLTSIDSGINKTAKGLYSIEGLRSGSMFGTVTGTQSGGGLLGTGVFGSKTTRNITDSGLIIEGTFGQLASDTNKAVIDFFEQVTVSKKTWYGKTSTWVETKRQEVDDATSSFFKDIFGNATKLFIEVGSKAGIDENVVTSVLNNLNVGKEFASLRGLKGEEFQQELSAIIGTILDDASLAIFRNFEKFAEFGEGMLETVIRVVDTNEKINQAVKNLGLTVDLTTLYGVTEALAEAAGGLEEFLDQSRYFAENFLTEAERVAPVQKAVVTRLAQLGYASVDTKAEFVALVKSLDLTTLSGISTYQSLMDLAPGFSTVISAVEDQSQALEDAAQGFRDFIQQIKDFKESLLLGASSTLTPEQKYAQARSQFEDIYAQAVAGDTVAMSKVTSSAQSFLEASRTYFASSEAYTSDFNSVLTKLDDATISASASASVAELQLTNLSIQTTLLEEINSNIAIIAGVPQKARGGRASGLTLVGELGPELVDFTYPGMVYPADQTRGMFTPQASANSNMGQVVQELRQVKQELAQLRKEQKQQTGDLILSNYDANQKASQEVVSAVVDTNGEAVWINRSKSEIK
jgi:predicted HTH domain antitoxin